MLHEMESESGTRGPLRLSDTARVYGDELVLASRSRGPRPVTRAPRRQDVALARANPREIRFEILIAADRNALA